MKLLQSNEQFEFLRRLTVAKMNPRNSSIQLIGDEIEKSDPIPRPEPEDEDFSSCSRLKLGALKSVSDLELRVDTLKGIRGTGDAVVVVRKCHGVGGL